MKSRRIYELSLLKQAAGIDPALAARMGGRATLEGALGGTAGAVLGGGAGLLTGIPTAGLIGKLVGGLAGSVAGGAHGAYAAAKNHQKPKKPTKKKEEPKEKSAAAVFNKYKNKSLDPTDVVAGAAAGGGGGFLLGQRRLAELLEGVNQMRETASVNPSEENIAVSKLLRNQYLLRMLKHIGLGAGLGVAGVYGFNRLKQS